MNEKEKYSFKIIELNNKSRKGKYVYIYDTKKKKANYYPYDPTIPQENYVGYQKENKNKKIATKIRIKLTKNKENKLNEIIRTRQQKIYDESELIKNFAKENIKNTKEITFWRKPGIGFDVNKKVREIIELHNIKDAKKKNLAIKSNKALAKYSDTIVEFYGDNWTTKEKNTYLGYATYSCLSLEEINQILNSANIDNREIDPSGGGEDELQLAVDLKTNNIFMKRIFGQIKSQKITYKLGVI